MLNVSGLLHKCCQIEKKIGKAQKLKQAQGKEKKEEGELRRVKAQELIISRSASEAPPQFRAQYQTGTTTLEQHTAVYGVSFSRWVARDRSHVCLCAGHFGQLTHIFECCLAKVTYRYNCTWLARVSTVKTYIPYTSVHQYRTRQYAESKHQVSLTSKGKTVSGR